VENGKLSANQEITNKSNNFVSILKVIQSSAKCSSSPVFSKVKNEENPRKIMKN
jgi:hypothetical protein